MKNLKEFLSIKENNVIPPFNTRNFRKFSRRKRLYSMHIFGSTFFEDIYTFIYNIDNSLFQGRHNFSDTINRKFKKDFDKNHKISRVIRKFKSHIFIRRRTRFFILTAASWRKKFRRNFLWKRYSYFNKKLNFLLYQNNSIFYNNYFLKFNFLGNNVALKKIKKLKCKF